MDRFGIATAGNWIVDRVKLVDRWPPEEELALISSEERGGGGGAYNCIADLHNLGAGFPLYGIGCIGDDGDGAWIRADLQRRGVEQQWIQEVAAPTSYTDVMSVRDTGRRTFFHCAGAGALFGPEHVPYEAVPARLLHLAYLLLLPQLDREDPEFGSVGARVLSQLQQAGIMTCLDVVTDDGTRARPVVVPALPYVDCLICNELEAGVIASQPTRIKRVSAGADSHHPQPQVTSILNPDGLRAAGRALLEMGVRQQVVVHMPEGGYVLCRDGQELFLPSLAVPQDFIAGANGAGDAFAAGVLYGLHEGWPPERLLRLAVATAAASLRHPTTTAGVGTLAETLGLLDRFSFRDAVM